jgi:Phage gp6-like head-tail connector protein
MADITVKVITPATSFSFLTLAEVKTFLGITTSTPAEDAQLQMMIDMASATIMRCCNRMFAKETVRESWREVGNGRLFLSHWPIIDTDIESVTIGDDAELVDPTGYELEEDSGKLSNYTDGWIAPEPTVVTYTGGYLLPDEAPMPLKQAAMLLVRDSKLAAARLSISGIRSLSHKDSRVQFYDFSKPLPQSAGGGLTKMTGDPTVDAILYHYTRLWV